MKKTTAFVMSLLTGVLLSTQTAFAGKPELECKAQLARASETYTKVLPIGRDYAKLELSEDGTAELSLTYSLNGATDLVYRLDLNAQAKPSNWNSDAVAFNLEVKLWDVKNNKLVATQSLNSDNVRTHFLLRELTENDKAIIVSNIPSLEIREKLLNSGNKTVVELANKGKWIQATGVALTRALVHPQLADFVSVHCTLEN